MSTDKVQLEVFICVNPDRRLCRRADGAIDAHDSEVDGSGPRHALGTWLQNLHPRCARFCPTTPSRGECRRG